VDGLSPIDEISKRKKRLHGLTNSPRCRNVYNRDLMSPDFPFPRVDLKRSRYRATHLDIVPVTAARKIAMLWIAMCIHDTISNRDLITRSTVIDADFPGPPTEASGPRLEQCPGSCLSPTVRVVRLSSPLISTSLFK